MTRYEVAKRISDFLEDIQSELLAGKSGDISPSQELQLADTVDKIAGLLLEIADNNKVVHTYKVTWDINGLDSEEDFVEACDIEQAVEDAILIRKEMCEDPYGVEYVAWGYEDMWDWLDAVRFEDLFDGVRWFGFELFYGDKWVDTYKIVSIEEV